MGTHRVTIELADDSYRLLRRAVESGDFASESEAVAEALYDLAMPVTSVSGNPEFDRWMLEEVLPADDELEADPSSGLTPEQLHEELAAARLARQPSR